MHFGLNLSYHLLFPFFAYATLFIYFRLIRLPLLLGKFLLSSPSASEFVFRYVCVRIDTYETMRPQTGLRVEWGRRRYKKRMYVFTLGLALGVERRIRCAVSSLLNMLIPFNVLHNRDRCLLLLIHNILNYCGTMRRVDIRKWI